MKQINNYIQEKLKINSKSKINSNISKKEKVEEFDSKYKILCYNEKHISLGISNYTFNFNERIRKENYSDLVDNIGINDQETVFKYLLSISIDNGAKEICKVLNESRIGYQKWEVENDKFPILLRCKNVNNTYYLFINKK